MKFPESGFNVGTSHKFIQLIFSQSFINKITLRSQIYL